MCTCEETWPATVSFVSISEFVDRYCTDPCRTTDSPVPGVVWVTTKVASDCVPGTPCIHLEDYVVNGSGFSIGSNVIFGMYNEDGTAIWESGAFEYSGETQFATPQTACFPTDRGVRQALAKAFDEGTQLNSNEVLVWVGCNDVV